MSAAITCALQRLSDEQLVAELRELVQRERCATAALVAHLAEFDGRRLYLGLGFPSLFAYCTGALRLGGQQAYNRIEAARAARRFPGILQLLASGAVNLTTVRLLAPHLTQENHEDLLTRAGGKSRLQVEELVARFFPRPPVPASIRKLPTRAVAERPASNHSLCGGSTEPKPEPAVHESASAGSINAGTPNEQPHHAQPLAHRPTARPLSIDQYKITFTANAETWRKLRQAQELLRHQVPDAELGEVFDRALSALLDKLTKQKFAALGCSRSSPAATAGLPTPVAESGSVGRHIPAEVRRAVWLRDGGSCAFVAKDGRRCGARSFVEFHHLRPYAVDGPATDANIALRCRSHNGYEAELYFGTSRRLAAKALLAASQPP
jgi:hypothetical protein